jgi:RNA polymerase sigma-70 factor (sigma-E family)
MDGVRVDSSFDDFVEARSTALLRTAYLLTGDRGHAEDLLQSALLRLARHWTRARDAPDAYARRVLVNLSHDRVRTLFRRPREMPLPAEGDVLTGRDPGFDQVADRWVVMRALAGLPPRQRQVIVLRFFEDQSVEQAADLLGVTTGTIKSNTSRALTRLRELLGDLTEVAQRMEVPHGN